MKPLISMLLSSILLCSCITLPTLNDQYVPIAETYSKVICDVKATSSDLNDINSEKIERIMSRYSSNDQLETSVPSNQEEYDALMNELTADPIQLGLFFKAIVDEAMGTCELNIQDVEQAVQTINNHQQ